MQFGQSSVMADPASLRCWRRIWTKGLSALFKENGGLERALHFLFSKLAHAHITVESYQSQTNVTMIMDLRNVPIPWDVPAERNRPIRFQELSLMRAGWRKHKGGFAG